MENVNLLMPYSYNELVEEISELLDEDKEVIQNKVWLEALNPGYNVKEDAIRLGVEFYIYDQKWKNFIEKPAVSFSKL
jgi:hypothetical protein